MNRTAPTLLIGRCSFWPEARDPEAWLRALATLAQAAAGPASSLPWTSPRAVGDTVLRGHLSRRGVPGLFGLDETKKPAVLEGAGLLEWNTGDTTWQLSGEARRLVVAWQTADHRQALEELARHLLRCSVWLRLVLLKLRTGAWELRDWTRLKSTNSQLRVGQTLFLGCEADPADWLTGLEASALGAWRREVSASDEGLMARIHAPKTVNPDDGLSLSPLKSPLYLLDSLGWLTAGGRLRLPEEGAREPVVAELSGPVVSATVLLDRLTRESGDNRGVFPLEPVMMQFAEDSGLWTNAMASDPSFQAWTDRLLGAAMRAGVIELFSAEPGQGRHGRGLFGDGQQKLLHWRVHPGFDELCRGLPADLHR